MPVRLAKEIVIFDLVPNVAKLKLLRSTGYSCPAAIGIVTRVTHPEALEPVQKVTEAAGTFGRKLVTVPAVALAGVVQVRDMVAVVATDE